MRITAAGSRAPRLETAPGKRPPPYFLPSPASGGGLRWGHLGSVAAPFPLFLAAIMALTALAPGAARAATEGASPDLTHHWVGFAALAIFAAA